MGEVKWSEMKWNEVNVLPKSSKICCLNRISLVHGICLVTPWRFGLPFVHPKRKSCWSHWCSWLTPFPSNWPILSVVSLANVWFRTLGIEGGQLNNKYVRMPHRYLFAHAYTCTTPIEWRPIPNDLDEFWGPHDIPWLGNMMKMPMEHEIIWNHMKSYGMNISKKIYQKSMKNSHEIPSGNPKIRRIWRIPGHSEPGVVPAAESLRGASVWWDFAKKCMISQGGMGIGMDCFYGLKMVKIC